MESKNRPINISRNMQVGKQKSFQHMVLKQPDSHMEKKKKKTQFLTSYHTEDVTVINLNIKMRDLKLLEKNKGDYLHDLKGDRKI